jgi:hypothetical protein
MGKVRRKSKKPQGSKMRFSGIQADAKTLGYSISYLWLCLTGRRNRPQIVAAYQNLKRDQARAILAESETQKAA